MLSGIKEMEHGWKLVSEAYFGASRSGHAEVENTHLQESNHAEVWF